MKIDYVFSVDSPNKKEVKASKLVLTVECEVDVVIAVHDYAKVLSCNACTIDVMKSGKRWQDYFEVLRERKVNGTNIVVETIQHPAMSFKKIICI